MIGQPAACQHTEQDGDDGRAFHGAVGLDQQCRSAQLGQDAILGGRVDGRADAGQCIGQQRQPGGRGSQQQRASHRQSGNDLDAVGDQHDPAFGQAVGKRAEHSRQHDIRQHKACLQPGHPLVRPAQFFDQQDGGNQQGIVGQGRQELRGQHRQQGGREQTVFAFLDYTLHVRPLQSWLPVGLPSF